MGWLKAVFTFLTFANHIASGVKYLARKWDNRKILKKKEKIHAAKDSGDITNIL